MTNPITNLKSLDDELAKDSMRGLWMREETLRREPAPFGKPVAMEMVEDPRRALKRRAN